MHSSGIRRAAAVACCGLLAGIGAAAARALEVPTLPTPTVSVTVSVPSLPAPTPALPPVTTSVTLTSPVPLPTPTPTPTTSAPAPTPSLPAPIGLPSLGGGGSGSGGTAGAGGAVLGTVTGSIGATSSPGGSFVPGPAAASSGSAAPEGTRPGEHVVAVTARSTPRRPGVVTVRFALAYARRMLVVVRGPLPSCNSTARFAVRGHRGTNRLRFDGTVGRNRLASGSYLIGIKPVTGSTVRWAAVHVGPRGAQPLPRRIVRPALGQCSSTTASRALLVGRFDSTPTATGGTAGAEATKVEPPQPVERVPAPEASVLPFLGIQEAAAELPSALGYFLLAILGGSLLGVSVFVVRFLRSPST
jgi:hypothetical protein